METICLRCRRELCVFWPKTDLGGDEGVSMFIFTLSHAIDFTKATPD